MIINLLSMAILASAVIAIYFRQIDVTRLYALFKPLTTILIIVLAIVIYQQTQSTYSAIILIGLVFALIGDVFLIVDRFFLQGLFSFLLAHLAFIFAFLSIFGFIWSIFPLVILLLLSSLYYFYIKRHLYRYSIPVAVYMLAITVMNWQAIGLATKDNSMVYWIIGGASLLFSFSDAVIAYKKFIKPFESAEVLILSTYWLAIFIFTIVGLVIN